MKKIAVFVASIVVLSVLFSIPLSAVELPLRVVVNGNKIEFPDAQPYIDENGRTQTPARFIGEALGVKVTWDGKEQKAEFEKENNKLVLYIGKQEYTLNGQKMYMDTAAVLKEDRTFVPARYVAEAFGASVRWDGAIKTVYVEMNSTATNTGEKVVAGMVVPKGTNLTVSAPKQVVDYEAILTIDFLRGDVNKQKDDMEKLLLQKFNESTVKTVMDYVRLKDEPNHILRRKVVLDDKTGQHIVISESRSDTITVWIYKYGEVPYQ